MNKEYKTPDTYGSKIRNCLSPLHNIATIIQSYKRDDYMSITGEEILEWFKKSDVEIELLDKKEYTEQEELVNDMMMLIASFSGKVYSLRAQENRKKLKEKKEDK